MFIKIINMSIYLPNMIENWDLKQKICQNTPS